MNFRESDTYQVVWLVRRLFRSMAQMAETYLDELGISAADRAAMEFLYPGNELSVPEIAARYNVSRQHIQVTVNRLSQLGLVVEKPNPRHKRSKLMLLSPAGRRLFEKIAEKDRVAIERLFRGIDARQCKQVNATLQALLDNIDEATAGRKLS
jgi:DNA-binding MarR family transcriptional regulator